MARLTTRFRALGAMMALMLGMTVLVALPAAAATALCSGASYSACTNAGYTDHGYGSASGTSYWGAYPGHNCTNYVAFVLSTVNKAPSPGNNLGNARDWANNARNKGYAVNGTPGIGSVAQWNANSGGVGSDGHVGYVERIEADGSIVVSSDAYSAGPFAWRKYSKGASDWPSNFIHFKDIAASTPPPPPAGIALELVHYWQSGSGATDAINVTPGGITEGGKTTIGAVNPGTGQFGMGDFDKDGIADLFLVGTQRDPSQRSVVFVAKGPAFTSLAIAMVTPMGQFGSDHGDVVIGDFTGDNRADVGVLFANNGASKAAFGVLDAASNFQSWAYLSDIPIGGHDGRRSDAVAGDFNRDGRLDLGVGFHQGTPSGNVDFFVLSGASSYQSMSGGTLPIGGWIDGNAQLVSGRFGTANDQVGAVYTAGTPTGKPDLFILNNLTTVASAWTLPVGAAPAGQRVFIGK